MDNIPLLVTVDENYLYPLHIMLTSLSLNNPGETFSLYIMHREIPGSGLEAVAKHCEAIGCRMISVQVDDSCFHGAPTMKQYPAEMYYRLLAPLLLSSNLSRILYLDPDILVINPIRPLWETDMKGNLFAAASHQGKTELINGVNQVRLGTDSKYYNSGVLLIDLERGRKEIISKQIFEYVNEHGKGLLLPDQDILNALYGDRILELDDALWNYDARNYSTYLLLSAGVYDIDWVVSHTSILHFCGKSKPWQLGYLHRFGILYKHYQQLTRRDRYI